MLVGFCWNEPWHGVIYRFLVQDGGRGVLSGLSHWGWWGLRELFPFWVLQFLSTLALYKGCQRESFGSWPGSAFLLGSPMTAVDLKREVVKERKEGLRGSPGVLLVPLRLSVSMEVWGRWPFLTSLPLNWLTVAFVWPTPVIWKLGSSSILGLNICSFWIKRYNRFYNEHLCGIHQEHQKRKK